MKIERLLELNDRGVCSISPDATVFEAIRKMADENVGALLVMRGEKVEGVISERDYARKVFLDGKSSKDTPVREIMTKDVCFATKDILINECMALMTEKRFRHLPVVEDKKVIGVISLGDVVKAIIDQQEHDIKDYERYIHGIY